MYPTSLSLYRNASSSPIIIRLQPKFIMCCSSLRMTSPTKVNPLIPSISSVIVVVNASSTTIHQLHKKICQPIRSKLYQKYEINLPITPYKCFVLLIHHQHLSMVSSYHTSYNITIKCSLIIYLLCIIITLSFYMNFCENVFFLIFIKTT